MTKKKYSEPDETTPRSSVYEPQASYGLSVNDLRTELIREILHIEDKSLLNEALGYLRRLAKPVVSGVVEDVLPYTMEAINARIDEAENDIDTGQTYTSQQMHDIMEKKYAWLCK
ncbi:hypothetical protein [uncultured Parabacteroides sp.]|uniref:hypothetical protein n=1 Tax=uncultured Parabacteroides sp. TaxID=512312 RepID=UPI0025882FA9|nr:hypothetical protein [uncultured Parabacteroides sp.]